MTGSNVTVTVSNNRIPLLFDVDRKILHKYNITRLDTNHDLLISVLQYIYDKPKLLIFNLYTLSVPRLKIADKNVP